VLDVARYGEPYNPFKAPERVQERHQADQASAAAPGVARGATGTGDPVLVQPQGGFARIEPVMPAEDAHF